MRRRDVRRKIPVTYSNGAVASVEGSALVRIQMDDPDWATVHNLMILPLPGDFDAVLGLDFLRAHHGLVGYPDGTQPVMDLSKIGLRFPLRQEMAPENLNVLDTSIEGLEPELLTDEAGTLAGEPSSMVSDVANGAEAYVFMLRTSKSDTEVMGISAAGEAFNFVKAAGAEEASNLREMLDGLERAIDETSLPTSDLHEIATREDNVAWELSPELTAAKEQLIKMFTDRGLFTEPSIDSVQVRDHMVDPLRLTPEGNANPPYSPARRLNASKLEALKRYLDELLARGFIRPSSSSFGAPVLLVVKADGSFRFTVDYRALNSVLQLDRFGLPRQDQILQEVANAGATCFSAVDAFHSFWQVRLRESDVHKTAMTTPYGLYEWLVCPQGLATSPSTLQRVITDALGDAVGKYCAVYVDDVLIYSRSPEEHVQHLQLVFERLHSAQIRLKLKKCQFFMRSLEYLGLRLTAGGTSPTTDKLRQLLEFPKPESKNDVKSLLGVVSWLRDYVPHVATWMAPLQELANSRQPWTPDTWSAQHQHCLKVLVHLLTSEPVLRTPVAGQPFAIMTDASDYAMGCVLMQQDDPTNASSRWHPVAYHSKGFKPRVRHVSATDREMSAIIEAVKKWQHLLADQPKLTIFGDHKPLSYYRTMDLSQGHQLILRQLDRLEALRTEIVYVTAKEVAMADLLSRDRRLKPMLAEDVALQHPALRFATIICTTAILTRRRAALLQRGEGGDGEAASKSGQEDDDTATNADGEATADHEAAEETADYDEDDHWEALDDIGEDDKHAAQPLDELTDRSEIRQLQLDTQSSTLWAAAGDEARQRGLSKAGGLLYYNDPQGRRRLFLPTDSWQLRALREAHDSPSAGHLGTKRTEDRLTRHFWWPTLKRDVRQHTRSCTVCLTTKPGRGHMGALSPMGIPFRLFSQVAMDYVSIPGGGPFKSALVICCTLAKTIRIFPIEPDVEVDLAEDKIAPAAQQAAKLYFEHIWKFFGMPRKIISDRDPRFTSAFWQALWKLAAVHLNMSTSGYPQTDGQSERSIRTVVQMLRAYADKHTDWHEFAPQLEYAYNDAVHEATGFSPFELMYGQSPHTPLQLLLGEAEDDRSGAGRVVRGMRDRLVQARAAIRLQQQKRQREYDRTVIKDRVKVGDWVLIRNRDRVHKLQPLWVGPFKAVGVKGKVVTLERAGRRFAKVNMAVCRLLPPAQPGSEVIRQLQVRLHTDDDGDEFHALEALTDVGWEPALSVLLRGHHHAWTQVMDRVRSLRGMRWGADAVGTLITKNWKGHGPTEALVIEYDGPAQSRDEACYRVLYADGDDEDLFEGEFERLRRAFLRTPLPSVAATA